MHGILSLPTLVAMRQLRPDPVQGDDQASEVAVVKQSPQFREGYRLLRKDFDVMVFFALVFIVGISSGCIENFAYVRMREVGGTGTDMGISRFVSAAAGVPMFWFSDRLTRGLGVSKVRNFFGGKKEDLLDRGRRSKHINACFSTF